MTKKDDNLIMLPTVDLCFKELMNNPKVRMGFIAALLDTPPEQIKETKLQPTELRREYGEQKLGILELKKLPVRTEGENLLISWMRFFAAKTRKEMRMVAQTDEYIDEAFEELEKLSADKQKWMEYEARQKAIRDYNTQVQSYWEEGQRHLKLELIRKKLAKGKSLEQIADDLETDVESIRALAEEISGETPSV